MKLTEFLLARIAEDEAMVDRLPYVRTGPVVVEELPIIALSRDRMAAECEAKRRIVEEHSTWTFGHDHDGSSEEDGACLTLRMLALPYADHPDYQKEWAA